jgi:DNA mismatch repair protein MutS
LAVPKDVSETPLMKQYYKIKSDHPDALLLFRVGDFYETFGDDAVKASSILGITLTKRANGSASHIALAGFPYHSLDTYLPKLIGAGQRVAICEQLEDPKKTKTIVQRGITEFITPGTSLSEKVLSHDKNNYLAAIYNENDDKVGIALMDLSTGEFFTAEGNSNYVNKILQSHAPSEILYPKSQSEWLEKTFADRYYTYGLDEWLFSKDYTYEKLINHFKVHSLKGYGIEEMTAGIITAGVILHYLLENKHSQLNHISRISKLDQDRYLWLDRFSVRNLELIEPTHPQGTALVDVLNFTKSPMGARLLKKWIVLPLREIKPIKERLAATKYFFENDELAAKLQAQIAQIGDLERIITKVSLQRSNPREIVYLKRALLCTAEIKALCEHSGNKAIQQLAEQLNACKSIYDKIAATIEDEPPLNLQKGGVIKKGVSAELDDWRFLSHSGKDYLLQIQKDEVEKTGISSLKIGYNNVFGYYLEVTHTHKDKVPDRWIRKQTLVNAERYITEELKQYEEKILQAEGKIEELEKALFDGLLFEINDFTIIIQQNANVIARLDCLLSLAQAARENHYVYPEINDSLVLDIKEGRHPVIEKNLPLGESYIPNDVYLDNNNQQIIILTGPNMSGKSAILRQTALIVLMAQMGSFVPATAATIGLVDKIFTRVGASDNLSIGESTFMVEMTETANILNNLSERSLIVLDEIGRGTSTYDGISIAWSITEYLHTHPLRPKTLFATHYHELNETGEKYPRISNYHVSVKEVQDKVIFLRKMIPGGSEHSFGIHVAQMAGIPGEVVARANEILGQLESGRKDIHTDVKTISREPQLQLKLFDIPDSVSQRLKEELQKIDINTLTPIEALMKINHLKTFLKKMP